MTANSGSGPAAITNVYSLEACMDLCTQATSSICTVAYWDSLNAKCTLYPNSGQITPNNIVGNGVRTARLLTPSLPVVWDATYLLAPGYDLSICGGPSGNYYNRTWVGVFSKGANGLSGPVITATRNDIFLITCGPYSYWSSGIQSTAYTTSTTALAYGMSSPQTPDDCARLCEYVNAQSGYSTSSGCRLWEFAGSGTDPCTLYASRGGFIQNPVSRPGIIAAGLSRSGAGSEFAIGGTYPATYKKRSLPPGVGPQRIHARDAMADSDHLTPDAIIPFYGH